MIFSSWLRHRTTGPRRPLTGAGPEIALTLAGLAMSIPSMLQLDPLWGVLATAGCFLVGGLACGFSPRIGAAIVLLGLAGTFLTMDYMPLFGLVASMVAIFSLVSRALTRSAVVTSFAGFGLIFAFHLRVTDAPALTALAIATAVAFALPWLFGLALRSARKVGAEASALNLHRQRAEIANELHDYVTHDLSLMVLHAEQAQLTHGHDDDLAFVAATARRCNTNTRQVMALLADKEAPAAHPLLSLAQTLDDARTHLAKNGFSATFMTDTSELPLSPPIEATLARVLHEAVRNVAHHGAPERPVSVLLASDASGIQLAVLNDVRPGRAPGKGHGLTTMHERAVAAGGSLEAAQQQHRWVLRLKLPAPPESVLPLRPEDPRR